MCKTSPMFLREHCEDARQAFALCETLSRRLELLNENKLS